MVKRIEKSAKNLNDALELAAKDFGVDKSELSYEVLQEVGKGLIGFLIGKEIKISAWVTKEAEAEEAEKQAKAAEKAAARQKETEVKAEKPEEHSAPVYQVKNSRLTPPKRSKRPSAPKTAPVQQAEPHLEAPAPKAEPAPKPEKRERREVPDGAMEEARDFLFQLLQKMGLDAQVEGRVEDNEIKLDVSGPRMGLLIGKRGDTLDAVQYLTSLFVNRDKKGYIKITIDTENYRSKREETLIHLAHGLERRVIRDGRPVTLEPMSPNERRIIHSALQGHHRVQTYSVGEEPNRKLVVAPADAPRPEK